MSSQDTQVNSVGCISSKIQIKTLKLYTWTESHAYKVYAKERMLFLPRIYFQYYKTVKMYRSNTTQILKVMNDINPKTVLGLKRGREYLK